MDHSWVKGNPAKSLKFPIGTDALSMTKRINLYKVDLQRLFTLSFLTKD